MSAMYGSRTSVQSYSSNMDIGDTFKLYERRFGNIYEANQLYDLLKLKVAILPGGKDSKQGPIIVFPSDSGIHNVSEHDILQCLIYLGSIPSESSVRRCFSIIIDNQRKTLSNQLNFILSCCQKTFDNAVSDVYILEEPPSLNIDLNGNITSANLHVVTASQLRNIFDGRHLTPSLGGSMNYNHDDWLVSRMFVESYVRDARSVCSEFDVFSVHMSSSLFQSTPSNLQNLWIDFTDMKRRAEDFIRKGDEFLSRNKSSSFESNEENEMIIVQKVTEVVRVVEEKLDGLERLWRRKDVEEQQKVGIDALEKEMNEVVEWILGPGDKLLISQVGIGRDYQGADELRKQHERLELKCLDSYGRYAELRHKVEAYVQYSTAEMTKAAELEAQRDYMDTVYRSFAKRLELRRNTVISAVKFHRLLEEIEVLLDEIRKRLNYKTDLDSVEDLLEILNELSEKLDFNYVLATREGLQLKDMLCLPVKNSYGQEVNINREPDIVHVENCLERLHADKEGIKEALEVKRLELKQFLQLKICDQNVEQAIAWIRELDGLINNPDSQGNQTLQDLERFQEELGKGENTAKNSFDYGQELLKASLYLRRVLDLDLAPNTDQSNRLNEAWRNFSRGSNENAARRTALTIFNRKSDEFLKAAEDMLANLDVIQNRGNMKEYQAKKSNLDQNHRELQLTADGLNERIQRPILFEHSDKNNSDMDNLQTAENIKIKIQKMKDQMNQLDRKWSSMSKNGYVPGRRRTSLEGSDTSSGSQPRRMDARSIPTNREVRDGSDRSNDDARAVNQMNEWLESHALKRIASTNDMGRTLESVEGFYEKHVEYLQDMKAQEHLYRGRQVRNFPQQWNVVQEIIKQRITLALSLIKFHLSYNKASEDMKRIERMIEGGTNENMVGSLRELEESEENMGRNADEFLDCVTNQTYKDEYLNVEQPKYFVRDILEQWKQKRNQLNRHLVATNVEDILFEAQQINDELTKLEDDFVKSSPSSRNMSALNNKMKELQSRISILRESYNNNKTSSFVDPSHSSEVEVQLDALNLKFAHFKRLLQASKLEIFNKDFLTSETISQNNVRPPQNNVYVVKPLQNTTAKKGESFKLTCWINASPAQKIQLRWLKDGILLNCNGDKHSSQYKDGQCDLIISDVSNEDSGRYSCVASDGQLAISTAELAVEASPSIKEPLKDVSVKEGEPVELSVKVVGNPIPTVQWFLNGKELSNSPDFQIFSKDETHTLRISEVFDEDKGLYTVVIKNRYGELTDRARLKVSVGQPGGETKQSRSNNWSSSSINSRSSQLSHTNANPSDNRSIPSGFIKPLTDRTSEAGEDIILECSLPLFPNPNKITWYKDGIEITRTIPSIRTSMQNGVCRLVIERADSSHSGKYICKAQLKDKLYETSMLLTVKDKYPEKLSQSAPETKYSSVTINQRKSDLSSGGDASFHVDPFESSLRTNDMPWKSIDGDSGFAVRSSSTPQFVKKLESSNLVEKSATTFACKVVGEPSPNIQWYHNGRLIRPSNKYRMKLNKDGECSLTVWDCNKQDAGHYTCCALNIVGRDVCSAELISEDANDIDTTSYVEPETLKKILKPKSTTKTEDIHAGVVEVLSEPSFSKSCITEVNVDEGETARIECKVYGHPVPDVTWYKNGKEIKRGGRYQMVLNQEGMHSLIIKLAQTSDAGVYTCRSHNKSGQATMDFNLQVEDVASKYQSKIHTLRNPAIVKTTEAVQPLPFLTGYTPVSMVFSDSTKMKMSSKQAELERNANNDISSHSLVTRNNNSSPMPLDHFPPRFLVTPDPIKIEEGGHAKFWAKVSASPQATVTWSINGLDIFTSLRFNVYFDGLMHVLEIMKVKKFDDGTIKVSAHNYKGDVHHTVQLSVTDAVNLRSHLHPSTNDILQSKKKSLSSIEDVTVKGGSTEDTREKNFTPDSAEGKINFPLDRYKAAIAKKEAKDAGTKDDDSNTESSFKSSRFSKEERELFGGKSNNDDSSNKKNMSQDETDFEKVKEKSDVFSGIETTKLKESEHKNVTKFSRYDGYSETKGHKFDRKGVDKVIEESDDNIKPKTITKSDAKDEQETLSQSLKNEIKDFKFSTKGNGESRDIPSKTEQNYSLEPSYRNKSPEDFTKLEKKSKSPDVDGSKNDGGFYQKSMKSTSMTETTKYKWKHHLDGEDAETTDDQYKPSIGETFDRKEESDHKSIELSGQKTIKSDVKLKDFMSEEQNSGMKIIPEDKARGGQKSKEPRHDYETETTYVDTKYKNESDNDTDHTSKVEYNKKHHHPMKDDAHQSEINISTEEASTHEEKQIEETQEDPSISLTEEDRAREQKYISTLTEEITFKDVNNVPQKFSTRLVKTVEYSKTNSTKSSTKDKPENTDEHSPSKHPYTRHAMSEFQWDIRDDENQSDSQNVRDHYKKWREDASMEMSGSDHQLFYQDPLSTKSNGQQMNEYGTSYSIHSVTQENSPKNYKHSYSDKATGDHLEISNKGVQYDDTGKIKTREAIFSVPIEKSTTIQDIETTDEITVETKVTQVKTVSMQLSEAGDINLMETTQVQTDTDMKETKKTKEREELVVSHLVSNVTEVLDQNDQSISYDNQEEQNAVFVAEKYNLYSTWNIDPGVLIAVHSYEPDSDEVMSLHEGEKLEFLEENSEDWWFVRKFFDNRQGFVPSRLLQTKEEYDKNISDKIAQQIDKLDETLSTKTDGSDFPPQMMNLLSDVLVRDGEPASLECIVSGNPKPSITWFHNSRVIKPSPDFLQFYDPDYVCSLSIREVFPEDGGRYTMIAKNSLGIASSSAELMVVESEFIKDKEEAKVSESPILVSQPKHLVVDEGQAAMFTCRFQGKSPMKVTWFKDGKQISPSSGMKLDVIEEEDNFVTVELTLNAVVEGQMGRYRAVISNDLGEAEALTSLVVKAQPKSLDFKANLKKVSRDPDTNITFKQEKVIEERSHKERLHSHTEADSSYGSSKVIQHDFRSVLKPSHHY